MNTQTQTPYFAIEILKQLGGNRFIAMTGSHTVDNIPVEDYQAEVNVQDAFLIANSNKLDC